MAGVARPRTANVLVRIQSSGPHAAHPPSVAQWQEAAGSNPAHASSTLAARTISGGTWITEVGATVYRAARVQLPSSPPRWAHGEKASPLPCKQQFSVRVRVGPPSGAVDQWKVRRVSIGRCEFDPRQRYQIQLRVLPWGCRRPITSRAMGFESPARNQCRVGPNGEAPALQAGSTRFDSSTRHHSGRSPQRDVGKPGYSPLLRRQASAGSNPAVPTIRCPLVQFHADRAGPVIALA